ncbi:MAG: ABC transporter permease [Planctomycetaceae bacterium]
MNLFTIAWKSLKQRALPSMLTSLNVALGVMLMVAVLVCAGVVNRAFTQSSIPYNLVIGPRGSELQLVLSSVYRIDKAIAKLPYNFLAELKADKRITRAVPLVFGDTTEEGGFPVVGTTEEYFDMGVGPDRDYKLKGKKMKGDFDAIIGHTVAIQNGWELGHQFRLVHGSQDTGGHVHDETFLVVGILAPTQTANDKTVFIDIDGFFSIEGHDVNFDEVRTQLTQFWGSDPQKLAVELGKLDALQEERSALAPDAHIHDTPDIMKSLAAVLVQTREKSPFDPINISAEMRNGYQAQAVNPLLPMQKLNDDVIGWVKDVLVIMSGLILVVSGVSIFVSIYNSMSDRRREISIMRALGAPRSSVFSIILAESLLLCLIGGLLGWLLGHALVFVAAPVISKQTGLLLNPWAFEWTELIVFPFLFILAVIVGFLPALTAYRTDVAKNL